jgi:hypothetical protein
MVNLNKLAKRIAKKEGKKKQVSIAQIKEIMKLLFQELYKIEKKKSGEVQKVLNRYK